MRGMALGSVSQPIGHRATKALHQLANFQVLRGFGAKKLHPELVGGQHGAIRRHLYKGNRQAFQRCLATVGFGWIKREEIEFAAALAAVLFLNQNLNRTGFRAHGVDLPRQHRQRREKTICRLHPFTDQSTRGFVHEQDGPGAADGQHRDRHIVGIAPCCRAISDFLYPPQKAAALHLVHCQTDMSTARYYIFARGPFYAGAALQPEQNRSGVGKDRAHGPSQGFGVTIFKPLGRSTVGGMHDAIFIGDKSGRRILVDEASQKLRRHCAGFQARPGLDQHQQRHRHQRQTNSNQPACDPLGRVQHPRRGDHHRRQNQHSRKTCMFRRVNAQLGNGGSSTSVHCGSLNGSSAPISRRIRLRLR